MSEYNMSHTGEQLDDAIQAVLDRTVTLDGTTLKVNENREIYVDVTDTIEEDNDLPVSSAAVAAAIEGLDKISFDDSFTVTTSEDNKTKNVSVKTADSINDGNLLPPTSQAVASALKDLDIDKDSCFVTETVYPLSSKENYTGVEVQVFDNGELDNNFVFKKIADNVYTPAEFEGARWLHKGSHERTFLVGGALSENGSWSDSYDIIYVIASADVGKNFHFYDIGDVVFSEAGTYVLNRPDEYDELYIPGTYKREVKAHDFDMIVECDMSGETYEVTSINKQYEAIAEALKLKKDVRLIMNIPIDDENTLTFLGSVEAYSLSDGVIQFGATANIATGLSNDIEQLHHFQIILNENDTFESNISVVGGESGDSEFYITTEVPQLSSLIDIGVYGSGESGQYYHKVVDNVYTQEQLTGKRLYVRDAEGTYLVDTYVQVQDYDVGKKSFRINNALLWVIASEDVNKELFDAEDRVCIFPEPGTYVHQQHDTVLTCEISGEYRKPAISNDFPLRVNAYSDWGQFPNISQIDCSYGVIKYALQEQRPVVMTLHYDWGDTYGTIVLNTLGQAKRGDPIVFTAVLNEWYVRGSEDKTVSALLKVTIDQNDVVTSELVSGDTDGRSIHYYSSSDVHDTDTTILYSKSLFPYSTFETINSNDLCINRIGEMFVVRPFVLEGDTKLIELKRLYQIKGDPFTYEDFTEEQLESLKSEIVADVLKQIPVAEGVEF